MFRRRPSLLIRPELNDQALHLTLTEVRPAQQLHGLGAGRTRPVWEPVAALLRDTGRDWDRRVHRVFVLAGHLPPAVAERWAADRPDDGDALVLHAAVLAGRAPAEGRDAARRRNRCVCAPRASVPKIPRRGSPCCR